MIGAVVFVIASNLKKNERIDRNLNLDQNCQKGGLHYLYLQR